MDAPFFSIIIPTRHRYETLQHSIRTVLNQEFTSFELIISDNSDPDQLHDKKFIEPYLTDKRVRYVRPPAVLAMSDHWEFAVSNASGEFTIIFGDDDGLVAGALSKIQKIIQQTNAQVVSWARIEYSWPGRLPLEYSNLLVIPYGAKTGLMDSEEYIKKILAHDADYRSLPMFYNSAISKNMVKILKDKTGRVFNASSPDLYSGYAFALILKKYIAIGYPLSINGVSAKSNGAAHVNNDQSVMADYWKLMREASTIKWPIELPLINSPYLNILEPFVQLSAFFPELRSYLNWKKIYKTAIKSLECATEQEAKEKMDIMLTTAKEKGLYRWLKDYMQTHQPTIGKPIHNLDFRKGFDGSQLVVDASNFGIENVYDVSIFAHKLCGDFVSANYSEPVTSPILNRIKRAAGLILKGV